MNCDCNELYICNSTDMNLFTCLKSISNSVIVTDIKKISYPIAKDLIAGKNMRDELTYVDRFEIC